MTQKLDTLETALRAVLGDAIQDLVRDRGEITITVPADRYHASAQVLRDHESLRFEQLMDLCGVDFSDYRNEAWEGARYVVVTHLLSITHNWRVRLKVRAPDDELPALASVTPIWATRSRRWSATAARSPSRWAPLAMPRPRARYATTRR